MYLEAMRPETNQNRGRLELSIHTLDTATVGELVTLQRAAFLRDAQLYGDPFLSSLTQTVAEIDTQLHDPQWHYLGAWHQHRLVGSVSSHVEPEVILIGRLMCAPDLEGRGIGTALLDAVENHARIYATVAELSTGSKSTANIAMYTRRGYHHVSESAGGPDWSVVKMRKNLPH